MPASITLKHLSYRTQDNYTLISDLDLSFGPRLTGLVGRNGVGKSTLLKLIAGVLTPSSGEIRVEGRLGVLRQSVQVDSGTRIADALGVTAALARLDRLEAGLGSEDDLGSADWTLPLRVETALLGVGLPPLDLMRPLDTLSGGQRTRISLAALLLEEPDMILLDEPTNNLDAEGRQAVSELLKGWRRGAVVVSHDRVLLEEMDAIVELTSLGAKTYGGNYSAFRAQKDAELAAIEQTLASAEARVKAVDEKIQQTRERKARKDATGARSRTRNDMPKILLNARKNSSENTTGANARLASRLQEMAAAEAAAARAKKEVLEGVTLKLPSTGLPAGRIVVDAVGLTGGPDPNHPVIRDMSFRLTGPERVAISGRNGAGKTSLLRLLVGDLAPQAGSARIFGSFALLDQSVSMLDPKLTIMENFRHLAPNLGENAYHSALARFAFRAEAASKVVGQLSGGEMLRAGLAIVLGGVKPPDLLILDEPTNHLDLSSIQAVEAGLRAYDGALLVVSHDRSFLEAIGIEREVTPG